MSEKRFRDERTGAELSESDLSNRIVPGDVYEVPVIPEDEAETDCFLADLGVAYREELARKIAEECGRRIHELDENSLVTVYTIAIEVLSKE